MQVTAYISKKNSGVLTKIKAVWLGTYCSTLQCYEKFPYGRRSTKHSAFLRFFIFIFFQKKEKYEELQKGWSRSTAKPAPKYFCLSCTEIELKAVQLDTHGEQRRTWFQRVTFEDN